MIALSQRRCLTAVPVSAGASSVTLPMASTLNVLKVKLAGAKDVSPHAPLMLTAIPSPLSASLPHPLATVLNVSLILTALLPCHASTTLASLRLAQLTMSVLVLKLPPHASSIPIPLELLSPSSANALNALLMLTVDLDQANFAKMVFASLLALPTLLAPPLLPSAHLKLPLFKEPAFNVP